MSADTLSGSTILAIAWMHEECMVFNKIERLFMR